MGDAKGFLLQECGNLRSVLEQTLRFSYGSDGSREFFEECKVRLKFIEEELESRDPADLDSLATDSQLLNELSGLIARIERSSMGEYSWPFVEELKQIARATCTEATLTDPDNPPKIHVLSDGGLGAYRIYTERNRPSASQKRLLTIVFPRTLKHFVLLHSILGHELGHAMWQCSKHQRELNRMLKDHLLSAGVFANQASTAAWLYQPAAPARLRSQLAQLQLSGVHQGNFFAFASWQAWVEEILCDFIGLAIFGPSFVAALANLLPSLDPSGVGIGQAHPPVAVRVQYMLQAARLAGLDSHAGADEIVKPRLEAFWTELKAKASPDPWFQAFTDQQVLGFINELRNLLNTLPPAAYPPTDALVLAPLLGMLDRLTPPVGYEVRLPDSVECRAVDFRQILYAGWITNSVRPEISFDIVNRLCEHAIMQQRGIDLRLKV